MELKKRVFSYYNPDSGEVEFYDEATGELVERRARYYPDLAQGWKYTEEVGALLAEKIALGGMITKLCDGKTFPPYQVIARWKKIYPSFKEMIDQATEDRSENFRDQIHQEVLQIDNDNYQAATARINGLKALAGFDNPKKFQAKQLADVQTGASVVIMIDTGIRREEVDVTQKELSEATDTKD